MKVEVKTIPIRHDGTLYKKGASFSISAEGYEKIKSHVTVLDESDEDTSSDIKPHIVWLDSMEPEELKAYADEQGIDVGRATSKEGILEKIKAADEPKA